MDSLIYTGFLPVFTIAAPPGGLLRSNQCPDYLVCDLLQIVCIRFVVASLVLRHISCATLRTIARVELDVYEIFVLQLLTLAHANSWPVSTSTHVEVVSIAGIKGEEGVIALHQN